MRGEKIQLRKKGFFEINSMFCKVKKKKSVNTNPKEGRRDKNGLYARQVTLMVRKIVVFCWIDDERGILIVEKRKKNLPSRQKALIPKTSIEAGFELFIIERVL